MSSFNPTPFFTLAAAAVIALAGCSNEESPQGQTVESPQAPESSAAATANAADSDAPTVAITDAWVKAAPDGMSAAFGILENSGTELAHIVGVTTPASASTELHITVDNGAGTMVMQEAADGFEIAPGEQFILEPGGNHLMLMELVEPVVAGDEVAFSLEFSDGATLDFVAVAKDYSGANEHYDHGDHFDHGDHSDHGDHTDHGDESDHGDDSDHGDHDG